VQPMPRLYGEHCKIDRHRLTLCGELHAAVGGGGRLADLARIAQIR